VDDEGVIARLRAGELEAFDELYARYQGRVYRYLVRMVLDERARGRLRDLIDRAASAQAPGGVER